MTRYIRFRDLKARGIVTNWTTLYRWVDAGTFPPGKKLGPRSRVWTDDEIEDHLANLPTAQCKQPGGDAA